MKRILFVIALSTLVGARSSLASGKPSLRLIETHPLTVRGANFKAGEQVTVTASIRANTKLVHASRAGRVATSGTFTIALPGVDAPNCGPWSVTATGASGTRASFKIVPQCGALPVGR